MTTFDAWMKAVDVCVLAKYGVSVHDLPDCPFYDWFDDDVRPEEAATLAVKEMMNA